MATKPPGPPTLVFILSWLLAAMATILLPGGLVMLVLAIVSESAWAGAAVFALCAVSGLVCAVLAMHFVTPDSEVEFGITPWRLFAALKRRATRSPSKRRGARDSRREIRSKLSRVSIRDKEPKRLTTKS